MKRTGYSHYIRSLWVLWSLLAINTALLIMNLINKDGSIFLNVFGICAAAGGLGVTYGANIGVDWVDKPGGSRYRKV